MKVLYFLVIVAGWNILEIGCPKLFDPDISAIEVLGHLFEGYFGEFLDERFEIVEMSGLCDVVFVDVEEVD